MSQIQPNPFLNAVRAAGTQLANPQHHDILKVLQDFCDAVKQFPSGNLDCWKVPGFVTNLGQEYRILVKPVSKNYEHLLIRAHVPAAGTPVMLDLYDDDLIRCNTPSDLEKNLLDFLGRPLTQNLLQDLAA